MDDTAGGVSDIWWECGDREHVPVNGVGCDGNDTIDDRGEYGGRVYPKRQ
jgi:hypothetical protein